MSKPRLQGIEEVSAFFNMAETVDILVREHRYFGEIENMKIGEAILYKINNIDQMILDMGKMADVIIKIKAKDGSIKNFAAKVLQKKVPRIIITFPHEEVEQKERKFFRANTYISTPLIMVKREGDLLPDDDTGMGNISNVSEGGVSIITNMKLQKGDTINFFLDVKSAEGDTRTLDLHGIVRSVQKQETGQNLMGVQFTRMDRTLDAEIKAYMQRRNEQIKII